MPACKRLIGIVAQQETVLPKQVFPENGDPFIKIVVPSSPMKQILYEGKGAAKELRLKDLL